MLAGAPGNVLLAFGLARSEQSEQGYGRSRFSRASEDCETQTNEYGRPLDDCLILPDHHGLEVLVIKRSLTIAGRTARDFDQIRRPRLVAQTFWRDMVICEPARLSAIDAFTDSSLGHFLARSEPFGIVTRNQHKSQQLSAVGKSRFSSHISITMFSRVRVFDLLPVSSLRRCKHSPDCQRTPVSRQWQTAAGALHEPGALL